MNPAPINEQIQVEPEKPPKIVTMRPSWAVWFSEAFRILSGGVVSAVKAATATTASYLDFATESSAKNAGVVTLTTGAGADIVTLDLGTVTAGQRWAVAAQISDGLKGGTAGATRLHLLKSSGTATVVFLKDLTELQQSSYHAAADATVRLSVNGIMQVTVAGTLVIKAVGASAGSDTTLAAGEGQIYAMRMK